MSPVDGKAVPLEEWVSRELPGERFVGVRRLGGGNSNETCLLETSAGRRILRRPPSAAISPSAHSMEREYRVLSALAGTTVPVPRPLALCTGQSVVGAPFLLMEFVDGVSLTDELPPAYDGDAETARTIGYALVDFLADLASQPWRELGLEGFGKPEGFLERQVSRWRGQYGRYRIRDLPRFEQVAAWLEENTPRAQEPGILHGDFHLDNCLLSKEPPPRILAVADWEMSTIGDPLLDLGLALAFWGSERLDPPAFPSIQAVTRVPGAPSREELAARYQERSGRPVDLPYYLALAFWKLGAIVEGAYAQYLSGEQDTEYARNLERDVPQLFEESARFAGIR